MHDLTALLRAVLLWLAALAGALGGGCASAPPSGPDSKAAVNENDFRGLFDKGEYNRALASASRQYPQLEGASRDQAALVAGMAASRVEKRDQAERWLRPLVESANPQVSGAASATLGMDAHRAGQHAQAITLLTDASRKLSGDDSARASFYAADSLAALGKSAEARAMYETARKSALSDRDLQSKIAARLALMGNVNPPKTSSAGQYTIQIGAYTDFARAMEVQRKIQASATKAGLPPPRVVTTQRTGKPLYAVRIGRFVSRTEGEQAQRRLGLESVVMVASGE